MGPHELNGLDQALARAGDGAIVIGPDSKVVLWNRSAERIMGYTAREVIGRSCCDVFAGRDEQGTRFCHQNCHVMTLDPVEHFDMVTRTRSGRPIRLNVSTLAAGNGTGAHLTVHLFRDVTSTRDPLGAIRQRAATAAVESEAHSPLTRRELEVLRLMAAGDNTKAAAERLRVSPATVRNHVQNILAKLGVHNRLQAVAYATAHRLL